MATSQTFNNVKVVVNDNNGSFAPNKVNRSISVKWTPEENYFELNTPKPQEKRDPLPPVFEVKEYGIALSKLSKGYKLAWEVNIQAAKIAGMKKVKSALSDGVDAMFKEIEENNL